MLSHSPTREGRGSASNGDQSEAIPGRWKGPRPQTRLVWGGRQRACTGCVVSLCFAGPVTCAALGLWGPPPTPHTAGHLSGLCLNLRHASPSSLGAGLSPQGDQTTFRGGRGLTPSLAHPFQGSMLSELSLEQGGSLESEELACCPLPQRKWEPGPEGAPATRSRLSPAQSATKPFLSLKTLWLS